MAGLHDGASDGGGRGILHNSRCSPRKTQPVRLTVNIPTRRVKTYGAAQPGRTMTVPKTAMAPKPATTTTVTRGGFGESVAKQSTMQRSATGTSSRSMGG